MNNLPNKLVQHGFTPTQAKVLNEYFSASQNISKVGVADADDEESAIKLANALKARLNEVIKALQG